MRHLLIILFTVMLFSSCDPPASTSSQSTVQNTTADTTTNQNTKDTTQNNPTQNPYPNKKDESGNNIVGKWIHSNEDDNAQFEVYRPETFNFPPSRGREALVIKDGGTFEFITIAPDDTRRKNSGKWVLENGKYQFTLDKDKTVSFTATLENNQLKKDKN